MICDVSELCVLAAGGKRANGGSSFSLQFSFLRNVI